MTLTVGRKTYTTRTSAQFYAETVAKQSGVHMYVHKQGVFWTAEPRNLWGYDLKTKEDV